MKFGIFGGKKKAGTQKLNTSHKPSAVFDNRDDIYKIADMARCINRKIRDYFGSRVSAFHIEDLSEDLSYITFTISFKAYETFSIFIHNEAGNYTGYYVIGEVKFHFKDVQKYFETEDYELFFRELEKELELRLPDKFLEARGWL